MNSINYHVIGVKDLSLRNTADGPERSRDLAERHAACLLRQGIPCQVTLEDSNGEKVIHTFYPQVRNIGYRAVYLWMQAVDAIIKAYDEEEYLECPVEVHEARYLEWTLPTEDKNRFCFLCQRLINRVRNPVEYKCPCYFYRARGNAEEVLRVAREVVATYFSLNGDGCPSYTLPSWAKE